MPFAPSIAGNARALDVSARLAVSGATGARFSLQSVQVSARASILAVAPSYGARASSLARLDDHSARLAPGLRFSMAGCARLARPTAIFGAPVASSIGARL